MLQKTIEESLTKAVGTRVSILKPRYESFGDISLNINQIKGHDPHINPEELVKKLQDSPYFEKVEVVEGFINMFLNHALLYQSLEEIIQNIDDFAHTHTLKGKRILVEFAHPNTHKIFHIGHLRNISIGESLSRILEANGAEVIRINYQGDVGLHIAKCLYAIMKMGPGEQKKIAHKPLHERIDFLGKAYAEGNTAYENDEKAKAHIHEINQQIYLRDKNVFDLWKETRQWSLDYFDEIYKRVNTEFKRLFFESEVADRGLEIARIALKKKILEESDGAVILNGKKHAVDTRVFINSLGLPTYEAKELGLAEKEFSEFGTIDTCIHVVGPEQKSFFAVTFKTEELIDPEKYKGKQQHFAYGFVDLKHGKMSSRKGNVLSGTWLLDEAKKSIIELFKCDEQTAEVLAVGAVKYGFLKVDAVKNISFDIKESVSLQGKSGPYIQYTYARIQSILNKDKPIDVNGTLNRPASLNDEELHILRKLREFPLVIQESGSTYSPHLIAIYIYELTQKFNLFYDKHPILKADKINKDFRLQLALAVGKVIKEGLSILGISVLDKV